MSHVAHINDLCYTYQWVMLRISMSRVTHVNESCRTYQWVVLHILWRNSVAKAHVLPSNVVLDDSGYNHTKKERKDKRNIPKMNLLVNWLYKTSLEWLSKNVHQGMWWGDKQAYCKAPQHTATHCNTLQHTATHCNTPVYVVVGQAGAAHQCSVELTCEKIHLCVWWGGHILALRTIVL